MGNVLVQQLVALLTIDAWSNETGQDTDGFRKSRLDKVRVEAVACTGNVHLEGVPLATLI